MAFKKNTSPTTRWWPQLQTPSGGSLELAPGEVGEVDDESIPDDFKDENLADATEAEFKAQATKVDAPTPPPPPPPVQPSAATSVPSTDEETK